MGRVVLVEQMQTPDVYPDPWVALVNWGDAQSVHLVRLLQPAPPAPDCFAPLPWRTPRERVLGEALRRLEAFFGPAGDVPLGRRVLDLIAQTWKELDTTD